jgi:hypothetical protein
MGQKSRNKKPKHSKKNNINMPGNIPWTMKPPNLQTMSQQKGATCEVYDCDIHKLIELVADIATGIWRIKNKFSETNTDDLPDEIKKAYRHVESTWDALSSAKVKVRDHTGEKYPHGNPALKVIASQPTPSVQYEVITETIKPTIYYNGRLIQMGQVIVEKPQSTESNEKLTNANASSGTSSKQNDKNLAKKSGEKTAKTKNEKELDKNKKRNTK